MGPIRRNLARLLAAVVVLAALASNHRTVEDIGPGPWVSPAEGDYYNFTVQGFLAGHTYLSVVPDAKLMSVANPYDPGQRNGLGMHDISYYRGHYYIYFGVTPAVLLYTPWKLLTGGYISAAHTHEVFVGLGLLAASGLFLAIRRRYFPASGLLVLVGGLLVIGFGSMTYAVLRRPSIWEVPIAAGYACAMLTLLALYRAVHASRAWPWYAIAGLAFGLAVGARPSYIAAAPVFALAAALRWRRAGGSSRSPLFKALAAMAIGAGVPAVGLMAYNYARFGNLLEFGLRYQLSGVDSTTAKFFSLGFVWFNAYEYLWEPAHWGRYFPFVELPSGGLPRPAGYYAVEYVYGLFDIVPFAWLAFLSPLALLRRDDGGRLPEFIALLLAWAAGMTLFLLTFNTATARYMVDFVPAVLLLAAVGALGLETAVSARWAAWVVPPGIAGLGVAAAFVGLMLNYQLLGLFAFHQKEGFARTSHFFNTGAAAVERIVSQPQAGPLELKLRFPKNRYGHAEPLITTGRDYLADNFFVVYSDSRQIVFGLDHTSRGVIWSDVLQVDYDIPHVLQIDMGSLRPPKDHPVYDGIERGPVEWLTTQLVVKLDDRVIINRNMDFYPGSPENLKIGADESGHRFTGTIESVRRMPAALPKESNATYGEVVLTLEFPDRVGRAEPLVSTGRTGAGDLLRVAYVRPGVVRFGYDHWSQPMVEGPEVTVQPGHLHVLRIRLPSLLPPAGSPGLARLREGLEIVLDGEVAWAAPVAAYPSSVFEIAIGLNRIGSSVANAQFSGRIAGVNRLPAPK